ncbi:MAG: GNAT family N-acetyltransferase [Nocardiopsaceae bacterium]|nr:GNAT family N-acetyltransferase [Nocardiopsaceae bacterium]
MPDGAFESDGPVPDGAMPDGPVSGDIERSRASIVARYGELARVAAAGGQVTEDCGPRGARCFGAAAYGDAACGNAAYGDAASGGVGELPEAALRASLGCGNPVAVAALEPGETVLDLGSGGGADVLLSARRVGPAGRVYGLDASPEMISLARANAAAAGAENAEFLRGSIEDVPLPEGHVDVVISNCVVNLSPDKPRALAEAFRVLRPGGRLGVADVIAAEGADPVRRAEAEQRTGCAAGTVTAAQYRDQLLAAGFTQISVTSAASAGDGLESAIVKAVRPAAPARVLIRPMRPSDADQVLTIYQAGLDTGQASFETAAPAWDAFDAGKLPLHRFVAADAATGQVLGWVAVSGVSSRPVYAGVVEHSVYVHPEHGGRGIGRALLQALIESCEAAGIWTIQSSVFPENTASLRLHEQAGFRAVGTRERVGRHHGTWRDTIFLERRSQVVGQPSPPDGSAVATARTVATRR